MCFGFGETVPRDSKYYYREEILPARPVSRDYTNNYNNNYPYSQHREYYNRSPRSSYHSTYHHHTGHHHHHHSDNRHHHHSSYNDRYPESSRTTITGGYAGYDGRYNTGGGYRASEPVMYERSSKTRYDF